MLRALELAARGLYTTEPNPRVGAVIVRDGAIVAEGWHAAPGGPHAEAAALADARARGVDIRGATIVVTLEPCNHHGRTPPCVDAIVGAGLARVVYAVADPHPQGGGGAARLRAAGIDIVAGVEAEAARELNIGFFTRHARGTPWVRAKVAMSLDGRTALDDGTSQWITGEAARADGHAFRARAGAIVTGAGTVARDDPQLTVRAVPTSRQPLRVVIDRHGATPPAARVLAGGHALIVTAGGPARPGWPPAVEVLALPDPAGRVDLRALLGELARREVNEVHVEAGARLTGAFAEADLVDEWLCYVAPALIGDPARGVAARRTPLASLAARTQLAWHAVDRVGDDLRILARRAAARD
ncbi:MAG: bifunctional diaminohydroxyphosphoribosylaminopyrimidine deaminase/5-amino-6-(5-phosphoribosylamino)uracil reductase RibD [Proteobacteria bacterium]|nr:bifunctional diaminohydroxyphosphoribosylaminopyrimidine deaminase/5-amino-6-(5-phosphoribosylamino)uracil reductase RibD [Pseudomonadota bacterium]